MPDSSSADELARKSLVSGRIAAYSLVNTSKSISAITPSACSSLIVQVGIDWVARTPLQVILQHGEADGFLQYRNLIRATIVFGFISADQNDFTRRIY